MKSVPTASFLKVKDVAEVFGVNRTTVFRWIEKGYLKTVKLPSGSNRIPRAQVLALCTELRQGRDKYTVVIIENEPTALEPLDKMVRALGLPVEVVCRHSGLDGLLEIADTRPDIVFVDHAVNDVDGLTLACKLRSHPSYARIPVVLVSDPLPEATEPPECVDAILTKPFSARDVERAFAACLLGVVNQEAEAVC